MTKILLIIVVTVLLVLWFKSMARGGKEEKKPGTPTAPEDMVRCAHCGVNLPRSEALLSRGHFYCCEDHRQHHGG